VRLRTDVTQDLYDSRGRDEGAWSACAGDFHEALG
jgi:hypothetical protein